MNSQPDLSNQPLTLEEYLRFEAESTVKHEFVNGEIYAFAGASRRHSLIITNIIRRLAFTNDDRCEIQANDVKLQAAASIIYYPDIIVACDPEDDHSHIITRPSVIIEVLSPSTSSVDLREKVMVYRQIESLRIYLVVDQEKRWVMHHWRDETGAWWRGELTNGEDRIPIRCLGMELTLDQIYQGIL